MCFCRNTIQSIGWSYHDNTNYQDKNLNGCNFWRPSSDYNFNDCQRRCSNYTKARIPYHELDDHIKQASADYRIRITVNSDASHCTNNSQNSNNNSSCTASIAESESNGSAASVTIVEIDDDARPLPHQADHSNVNVKLRTHIQQKKPKQQKQHYNEKAIDVPAEFERRAYEYQRNELSPFVRNLQPNSQVNVCCYFFFPGIHIYNEFISICIRISSSLPLENDFHHQKRSHQKNPTNKQVHK